MLLNKLYDRQSWLRSAVTAATVVAMAGMLQSLQAQADPIVVSKVTISLVRESDIPARAAGVITAIHVQEGQSVVRGDVIAVMDNERQRLAVQAAKLNLQIADIKADDNLGIQTAMAQLKEAEAGQSAGKIALMIAEEQAKGDVPVRVAAAETRMRQLELNRAESARSSFKGSISETELDRLRTAVQKGQLETEQAERDLRVRQLKPQAEQAAIDQKAEEIHRFQTLVDQEKRKLVVARINRDVQANDVSHAELELEQRSIRVPFDGTVVKVETHTGEWLEPGTPVARVIDLKTLQAEGFLSANQASQELIGHSAIIRVAGDTESVEIPGTVTFVSPEVDPVLQQVRFRVEFDNSRLLVRPGTEASLTIEN